MRYLQIVSVAVAPLVMISAGACSSGPAPAAVPTTVAPAPITAPTEGIDPTSEPAVDFENNLEDFDPSNFGSPTIIDNQWFPLRPGAQSVFEGLTVEGGRTIPHRIVFIVTDLTKEISGLRTVVAWISDYSDDELVEAEVAFYAQDNDGNVWSLGEYPEVYENGKLVDAPAWIPGLKGARAGIVMKAEPEVGLTSYSQGWGPAVDWTDRGQVVQMGQQTCVAFDCYQDVLVTEEFSRSEPEAFQVKYYASGVGVVQVTWRGADATREELELVEFIQLSPEALEKVRAEALEFEKQAYLISREVYDETPPAEYIPPSS